MNPSDKYITPAAAAALAVLEQKSREFSERFAGMEPNDEQLAALLKIDAECEWEFRGYVDGWEATTTENFETPRWEITGTEHSDGRWTYRVSHGREVYGQEWDDDVTSLPNLIALCGALKAAADFIYQRYDLLRRVLAYTETTRAFADAEHGRSVDDVELDDDGLPVIDINADIASAPEAVVAAVAVAVPVDAAGEVDTEDLDPEVSPTVPARPVAVAVRCRRRQRHRVYTLNEFMRWWDGLPAETELSNLVFEVVAECLDFLQAVPTPEDIARDALRLLFDVHEGLSMGWARFDGRGVDQWLRPSLVHDLRALQARIRGHRLLADGQVALVMN